MTRMLPPARAMLLVSAAIALSLLPGLLPRGAATQGLLTGLFAAAGLGLGALGRRTAGPTGRRAPRCAAAVASLALLTLVALRAAAWDNDLRAAMGVAPVGVAHWASACAVALLVAAATVGCVRLARAARRSLVVAAAAIIGMAAAVPAASAQPAPAPAPVIAADRGAIPWETLGAHGQQFVSASGGARAVRIYAGMASAPNLAERTRLAVAAAQAAAAFSKVAIVIAVLTGSGWVDAAAVDGIERRFDGDVAIVAVQYATRPSWQSYLLDREQAQKSAGAVITAFSRALARLSEDRRPDLYVYGQSLGAFAGSRALSNLGSLPVPVCAALWAGPPPGTALGGAEPRLLERDPIVVANASDPVPLWTAGLLVQPPPAPQGDADAPRPPWLPVVSFLHTTVDLLGSLAPSRGHGHRYGPEQGTLLPSC
jgi:uncharacterized membrane protein